MRSACTPRLILPLASPLPQNEHAERAEKKRRLRRAIEKYRTKREILTEDRGWATNAVTLADRDACSTNLDAGSPSRQLRPRKSI